VAEEDSRIPLGQPAKITFDTSSVRLGVLAPGQNNPYFIGLFSGMEAAAREKGATLEYRVFGQRDTKTADVVNSLVNPRIVDGLLVALPDPSLEPYLRDLDRKDFPLVVVSDRSFTALATCLVIDNAHGALLATRHLLKKGHKRIGLVAGAEMRHDTEERREGYRRALREAGIEPDESLVIHGNFNVSSGLKAGNEFLAMAKPPTAVFAMNDMMAAGVLTALKNAGKAGSMDVVGFDDIPLASIFTPPITTVAYDLPKLGRISVEKVLQIIREGELQHTVVQLETTLVVRKSA
jgi:LacI family transcriptional regulator